MRHAPQRAIHLAHCNGADLTDVFVEGGDGIVVDGSRGVRVVNARVRVRSTAVLVRAGSGGGSGGGGSSGVPLESVSFSGTAVLSAAMAYRLQVQSGGVARGVRFERAGLGGESPAAGVDALSGYGADDDKPREMGPDHPSGLLRGRGHVGAAAAVEVEAGGVLEDSAVAHIRGSWLVGPGRYCRFCPPTHPTQRERRVSVYEEAPGFRLGPRIQRILKPRFLS